MRADQLSTSAFPHTKTSDCPSRSGKKSTHQTTTISRLCTNNRPINGCVCVCDFCSSKCTMGAVFAQAVWGSSGWVITCVIGPVLSVDVPGDERLLWTVSIQLMHLCSDMCRYRFVNCLLSCVFKLFELLGLIDSN